MNARRFDELIQRWRTVASRLPDRRTGGNTQFETADIALSAFGVFFTQCRSFLSFHQNVEQTRGRNNARSLFQVGRIPSDNHVRQTLDPVVPSHLFSLFVELHQAFEQAGLLPAMRAVNDIRLIAVGARRKLFTHLEALTTNLYFATWERLMDFMLRGLEIGPYAVQKAEPGHPEENTPGTAYGSAMPGSQIHVASSAFPPPLTSAIPKLSPSRTSKTADCWTKLQSPCLNPTGLYTPRAHGGFELAQPATTPGR